MSHQRASNNSLSETEVGLIKARLRAGQATPKQLAEAYGVAPETIRRIGRGETWRWVEPATNESLTTDMEDKLQLPTLASSDSQASLDRLNQLLGVQPTAGGGGADNGIGGIGGIKEDQK